MTGCLGSVCQRGQARRRVALAGLVGLPGSLRPRSDPRQQQHQSWSDPRLAGGDV